jgi:hypothetical protein
MRTVVRALVATLACLAVPCSPAVAAPSSTVAQPPKLAVTRNLIDPGSRTLNVLAPISRRAAGAVVVTLESARRRTRFTARIDAGKRRVLVAKRIPAAQARRRTGIVTISYPGDADTQPAVVRLRAARVAATLHAAAPTLGGSPEQLRAAGTVSARARGIVRVEIAWIDARGAFARYSASATVRRGHWTLSATPPRATIASIAGRRGTLHSSIAFTGYRPAGVRGELVSYQVLGRPRTAPAASGTPAVSTAPAATITTPTPPPTPVAVAGIEVAQTHVLPPQGLSWTTTDATKRSLHLTGGRDTLVLARIDGTVTDPRLQASNGETVLGSVPLAPPSALPPAEDAGPAYATDRYSATLPAGWVRPGLKLRVTASDHPPSADTPVTVGADPSFTVRILPFYLFGATEQNTKPLSVVGAPDAATKTALHATWPVAKLAVADHPAGKAVWPTLVIPPRADSGGTSRAAYVAASADDYMDGFAGMGATLSALGALRVANGEGPLDVQYYGPLLSLNAKGQSVGTGGGLGGGSAGVGDDAYRGVFIHEQGHAFGLPHAGESFDAGGYPYAWGSLRGSAWGWDEGTRQFLSPFVPTSADTYSGCAADAFAGHPRASDAGRCVKQDPMQSGAGDQSDRQRFATFSDFSMATMQRYFENARPERDTSFASGYKRWDASAGAYVEQSTATTGNAQSGLHQGLPIQHAVPVNAIVFTRSNAGTPAATRIYPPLTFTGNLLQAVDPASAADRALVDPGGSGLGRWFCINSGCDLTLRVTYAGGTVRNVLVQGAFRAFNDPGGATVTGGTTATSGASFKTFAVNVPADHALTKIELLSTPNGWEGLPASPSVLASWTP